MVEQASSLPSVIHRKLAAYATSAVRPRRRAADMGETPHLYPLLSCTSTVLRTEHEQEKQRILVFDALKCG
jgi:hypothetical protein